MYQRYANPMELMDNMLGTGRLMDFVGRIIDTIIEEKNEKTLWEYWLHKDFERSWAEFRDTLNDRNKTDAAPTQEELKRVVEDSAKMLMDFRPDCGGDDSEAVSVCG